MLLATLGYLGMNALFAFLYMFFGRDALTGPASQDFVNEYFKAYFFSVQTSSTIGYGHITPVGLPANIVVTLESFVGLLCFAIITGLVFARFSRPTARIIFSKSAIVAPFSDITAFEFRIVNARSSQIIELEAKLFLARYENENGQIKRKFHQLKLERQKVAFFPLSWTIVHPIDASSPLFKENKASLLESDAEFLILLTGVDESFNQSVHARSSYKANEVIFDAKFSSIFDPETSDHFLTIDVNKLNNVEELQ